MNILMIMDLTYLLKEKRKLIIMIYIQRHLHVILIVLKNLPSEVFLMLKHLYYFIVVLKKYFAFICIK